MDQSEDEIEALRKLTNQRATYQHPPIGERVSDPERTDQWESNLSTTNQKKELETLRKLTNQSDLSTSTNQRTS